MADIQRERMDAVESAMNALVVAKGATIGESLVVYSDPEQVKLGKMFADAGIRLGLWTRLVELEAGEEIRRELDTRTKELLTSSKTDLAVNVFRTKAGETSYRGRFMKVVRRRANRILHCPGISLDMFTEGAAALTEKEYEDMFAYGYKIRDALKGTHKVHVTCARGSDFSMDLGGKDFQVEKGTNIPTGEINVMPPIGDSFEGKLVATSGGVGRLYRETPVEIYSKDGLAGEVKCKDEGIRKRILEELDRDNGARYLGEFAIGINPKARVIDAFIEAEKVVSTIHVAFGGSYRPSKTHLDLLVERPTVTAYKSDGTSFKVMDDGKINV